MGRSLGLLLLLVVSAALASCALAADKCFVTDREPLVPYGLELCYMHSHKACCLPGFDQQIQTAYSVLVPGGLGCGAGSQRIYASLYALREYLCLPCDPKEPLYRFESVKGDMVDGGVVPPSTNSVAGEQTWRICRSFLYGEQGSNQGMWGDDGSRYSQCGVIINSCLATPVFNIATATFETPSSSCKAANELVIPSIAFEGASDPAVRLLAYVAQSMPDFQIVVVNDSDPSYDFDKTPCFGRDAAWRRAGQTVAAWLCSVLLLFLTAL